MLLGTVIIFGLSWVKIDVNAQGLKRRNEIKSTGNLKFENGEVYVTASDFVYLADEIDKLESIYKCNLVNILNSINTYFKSDGSISHDSSQNEINNDELKTNLSFAYIKQGILESQSLKEVKNVQATDLAGNPLYYLNEEAKHNNDTLQITTSDSGFPLYYMEVEANNISAGRAAWVNGILIKGNGEDNRISWNNGYNEGYTKGAADALGKININYTYHRHTGNTSQVGGCYGILVGTRPNICGCNNYIYEILPGYEGHPTCGNCYHNHGSKTCDAVDGYSRYEYIGLNCGKTEETIESATIIY